MGTMGIFVSQQAAPQFDSQCRHFQEIYSLDVATRHEIYHQHISYTVESITSLIINLINPASSKIVPEKKLVCETENGNVSDFLKSVLRAILAIAAIS